MRPVFCRVIVLAAFFIIGATRLVYAADEYAGFPQPKADFQAHVQEVRKYLLEKQMSQRSAEDVRFNLPFELKASADAVYRGKFLLIHGLNDSPYIYSDVASELVERGFDVRAILLPGHGSTPKAQLRITAKAWLNAAREQLRFWRGGADVPMYLGGFSMGSVISTILALEEGDIAGMFLFSPAYRSSQNHLLRWAGIYSRFKPWVFGGMIIEDNPTKYNSIPINGVAQYYNVTKILKRKWKSNKLAMPVLSVASVNDSVVDIDFLIKIFENKFVSDRKKLILYSTEPPNKISASIEYRTSVYPDLRVLSQSHQGVLMAPDNPLFGKDGSVLVCNGNDWPTFSGCLYSDQKHWYGAQHTPSPDGVPVARTTYNPDFYGLFEAFDKIFQIE